MNTNKQKHLEFIQVVITRMANNSFLLKGWSVTLIAALFALGAKDSNPYYIYLAYIPTFLFWFLDGYFLHQERLYRSLYDSVRQKKEEEIDFSLDAHLFAKNNVRNTWLVSTLWSKTVAAPYVVLVIIMLITMHLTIK